MNPAVEWDFVVGRRPGRPEYEIREDRTQIRVRYT